MKSFYTNVTVRGDSILYRGVEDGVRIQRRIPNFEPTFYVPTTDRNKATMKTMDGRLAAPIVFDSIKEAKKFHENHSEVSGFELHGMDDYAAQYIAQEFPEPIEFDLNLIRYFDVDIENKIEGSPDAQAAATEITAITIYDSFVKKYVIFACKDDYKVKDTDVIYKRCRDEYDLLAKMLTYWTLNTPDIVTGWHIKFYDIPYIVNRMRNILGNAETNKLSPWGVVYQRMTPDDFGNDRETFDILGIAVMDGIDMYKKFPPTTQERYSLEFISKAEELPQQKIDYKALGYRDLNELYEKNFDLFIDYNLFDVRTVEALIRKKDYFGVTLTIAYDSKINYKTVFGPVATWDSYLFNYFRERGICVPPRKSHSKDAKNIGGFVKEPIPGRYKWVVSVDAASLYPSVDIEWNIGPETLVAEGIPSHVRAASLKELINGEVDLSWFKENNLSFCANKVAFTKDKQSAFADIFSRLFAERAIAKKQMLEAQQKLVHDPSNDDLKRFISAKHNKQQSTKILLNSGYGAMSNVSFRYFDIRLAEAITVTGQLVIQWGERHINEWLNNLCGTVGQDFVIMVDTDALYITLDPLIKKFGLDTKPDIQIVNFIDGLCKNKIQPFLEKIYAELMEYTNAKESRIVLKRESIADSVVVTAKKRYAMSVWDVEGVRYDAPKVKIAGIEAVRSSTPAFCRERIKKALEVILHGSEAELHVFVAKTRQDFMKQPIETVAFPRGVNGLEKWGDDRTLYKSGTPIHVKASLLYNDLLKKKKLDQIHAKINSGDKVKYIYLKEPNIHRINAIAFPTELPKEFQIEKYIDFKLQFSKTFLDPISNITNVIGWTAEPDEVESLF